MKLYYMPGACSLASHIVLEWIGKPFTAIKMSHDAIKTPDFIALNPAGAVPVLDVDGWVLTQNAAILNYLAETSPESSLAGDGTPKGHAEVNRWLGFINADMHPTFQALFGSTAYLEDEAVIAKTKDAARTKLRAYFQRADHQLQGRDWLTGSRSIVDPYLFVVTRWAKAMKVDLSGLGHLEVWFQRMHADAGVRKAMAEEGLG